MTSFRLSFVDAAHLGQGRQRRRGDIQGFEATMTAEVVSVFPLTPMETLYRLQLVDAADRRHFSFEPGQFVMLEIPGIGEAPFSISSSPSLRGDIELCIRKAGTLTNFLARVERGAMVGLRGPFGTGFPMATMHGQNLLLVAGGLGLVPLRSPIAYVQENRSRFGEVHIVYGTRSPAQLLFTYQYELWEKDDIGLHIIVERPDDGWAGPAGMITDSLEGILAATTAIEHHNTFAIVCGPPVMFKFVCSLLQRHQIPMQKMFVSLERRMHCGMGKCCRCNVGSTYTCLDGPVFDYWTVMNLKEAI
ncbi:MAG: FAD/NAD(P)-binding protein [Thermodesulfobacteriota bacterium]